ncbi:MAG: DUF6414 family protein [Acidimicrobiales bacterium]
MVAGLHSGFDLPPEVGVPRPGSGDPGHDALRRLERAAADTGALHRVSHEDDLSGLHPGDLVEMWGTTYGNPLIPVLDFVAAMMPLAADSQPTPRRRGSPGGQGATSRGDWEQEEAQRVLAAVVRIARDDLRAHAVVDVLFHTDDELPVVLTCTRGLLGAGEDLLVDRHVRVLGKVASVLPAEGLINLFRHSSMATAGPQACREMLAELGEGGLELSMADPVVEGPGLEILPVAILI